MTVGGKREYENFYRCSLCRKEGRKVEREGGGREGRMWLSECLIYRLPLVLSRSPASQSHGSATVCVGPVRLFTQRRVTRT